MSKGLSNEPLDIALLMAKSIWGFSVGVQMDWWWALPDELKGAIYGALATVCAAALGAWGIIHQIGRQAGHAISQAKLNERIRLKLQVYEGIAKVWEDASNASTLLPGTVNRISTAIRFAQTSQRLRIHIQPPDDRPARLIQEMGLLGDASIALIRVIEKWEIVDPRMKVFQTAINAAMHDVRDAYTGYFKKVMTLLPVDLPQGGIIPWQLPSDEDFGQVLQLGGALDKSCTTFGCYADDFLREMQKALLEDLFDGAPEVRQPLDPAYKVIRLEDREVLERFFDTETEWGRFKAEAEENARGQVRAAQAPPS